MHKSHRNAIGEVYALLERLRLLASKLPQQLVQRVLRLSEVLRDLAVDRVFEPLPHVPAVLQDDAVDLLVGLRPGQPVFLPVLLRGRPLLQLPPPLQQRGRVPPICEEPADSVASEKAPRGSAFWAESQLEGFERIAVVLVILLPYVACLVDVPVRWLRDIP